MHSSFTRLQNVFGFFTTVAFVLGAFIAATDLGSARTPSGVIKTDNIQVYAKQTRNTLFNFFFSFYLTNLLLCNAIYSVKGRPHYYSSKKEEYAIIRFSLEADLSSLFTWNTKQLFVYVTADWTSPGGINNTAVIWDSIITNPSADHLQNIGPVAMKKLKRSAEGKSIAPER
jgi:signal peptidase complex subunit 3